MKDTKTYGHTDHLFEILKKKKISNKNQLFPDIFQYCWMISVFFSALYLILLIHALGWQIMFYRLIQTEIFLTKTIGTIKEKTTFSGKKFVGHFISHYLQIFLIESGKGFKFIIYHCIYMDLKACVRYFSLNFYFSSNGSPSKTMFFISSKNLFLFSWYSSFCISVFSSFLSC